MGCVPPCGALWLATMGSSIPGPAAFEESSPWANFRLFQIRRRFSTGWGPSAHLLHYAIGADGGHVNFLAVVEGPQDWAHPEKGLAPSNEAEALALFQGWHPAVIEMIAAVRHELRWGLFPARPLPRWRRGRVVLLGDAAHAMLPHHGQGANVTIEDAVTIAEFVAADSHDLDGAFAAYETLRRPRTRAIQRASWMGNRALHLPDGPEAGRRDALIARFPEKFGWIHGFDALKTARASLRAPGAPRRLGRFRRRRTHLVKGRSARQKNRHCLDEAGGGLLLFFRM
jgi:salicylate hydroxylase